MGVKGRIKKSIKIKPKKKRNTTKHNELVKIGKKWLLNQNGKRWSSGVVFGELVHSGMETPDVIGFASYGSAIIEVKTSRADFSRDKNKMFRRYPDMGMGGYRFYLCPKDLIKKEELPEKWGLIYVDENKKARIIVEP